MTQWPYERPVTRSVSALLTGSSRQLLNGFIGSTPISLGLDAPAPLLLRAALVPVGSSLIDGLSGCRISYLLVALRLIRDLLLWAKHLFVAARTWLQS